MSKMLSIAKYEYRMQVKRIAGWIVLLFVLASSMMGLSAGGVQFGEDRIFGGHSLLCPPCVFL